MALNKDEAYKGVTQYHVAIKEGDIGYVKSNLVWLNGFGYGLCKIGIR